MLLILSTFRAVRKEGSAHFIRKGVVGDHKTQLSLETIAKFDEYAKQLHPAITFDGSTIVAPQ